MRGKRKARRYVVLGSFFLLALGVLTVLTFRLSNLSLEDRNEWTAYFGRDSSIQKGFEVFTNGKKVGRVSEVELVPDAEIRDGRFVRAVLEVRADVSLWEGAEVQLQPRGILGGFRVVIERGDPTGKRISPDRELRGRTAGGLVEEMTELVRENRRSITTAMGDMQTIIAGLREGRGTAGRLLSDDELYEILRRTARNLESLTRALNDPRSTLGRLAREPEIYDDAAAFVKNLREISDQINAGKGTVGALLRDETVARDLKAAVGGLRTLVDGLNRGEGAAGLLLRDPATRENVADGIAALSRFVQRVEASDGTLSLLLSDREVYDNLRQLTDDLAVISGDLRDGKGTVGMFLRDDRIGKEALRLLESFRESGEIARENAPLSSLASFTSLFFNVLN